ncbi:MAG TPA: DUF1206 domain-containing protein [Acidimicrobiales bacterium]|jgi:hypothetical protein|nr:DUF1206 domain-containing protein [Acidimicrobiales bacterium]
MNALSAAARVGLVGRTVFYLVLSALTVRIAAVGGAAAQQDNASGALTVLSRPLIGKIAIGVVAVGFFLLGIARLVGAARDSSVGPWRRVATALQGFFYLALAYVPASFLAGRTQTGSEQQQHRTAARLLGLPAGRELVIALGAVMIVVCAVQIHTALSEDFTEGMRTEHAPVVVRKLVRVAGAVGISARAIVFVPIGVFFIVAAIQLDPNHARGLDAELLILSGHTWGVAVLALVALGFSVFAVYSGLEARYREVVSAT